MAQAVVAQIGARGRVVGAEALPAIAFISAGGVAWSRRSRVARSRRIGIGGAGTVAVSGAVAIAEVVAVAGRVAVAGVVGVGVVGAAVIAIVPGLGGGDGAADDRAGDDARRPAAPAAPPLHGLDLGRGCTLKRRRRRDQRRAGGRGERPRRQGGSREKFARHFHDAF